MDDSTSSLIEIERALNVLQEYQSVLPLISKTGSNRHTELINRIYTLEKENAALSAQNILFVTKLNARQTEAQKRAVKREAKKQAEQAKKRQDTRYKISINYQQSGPYSIAQLKQKIFAGNVTKEYYVCQKDSFNWLPIGEIPELKEAFYRNSKTDDTNKIFTELDRAINTLHEYKKIVPLLSDTGPDGYAGLISKIQTLEKENAAIHEENKHFVEKLNSRSSDDKRRTIELDEQLRAEQVKSKNLEEQVLYLEKKYEKTKMDEIKYTDLQKSYARLVEIHKQKTLEADLTRQTFEKQINETLKAFINKYIVSIDDVLVGIYDNSNNWISQPGSVLKASEMRFIKPCASIRSPLTGKQNIEFYVKIINPNGTIKRLNNAPDGYSYTDTVEISLSSTRIEFIGIGNRTQSIFSAGNYRVEIWLGGICIGTTTVQIQ